MVITYRHSTTLGMRTYQPGHEPLTKQDIDKCEQLPGGQWRYIRPDGTTVKLSEDKSNAWVVLVVSNDLTNNRYSDYYTINK